MNGINVVTNIVNGKIVQSVYDVYDEHTNLLSKKIIDTEDKQIREALIELGWTPPNGQIDDLKEKP